MMIPAVVLAAIRLTRARLPGKPGARSNIHLAAYHRIDSCLLRGTVKINRPVHNAVVGNGEAVHAKFFRPADNLANFT